MDLVHLMSCKLAESIFVDGLYVVCICYRSVMNLIKLVMKFHQAEAAYSRSLLAISRINISSIGSSEGYKVAADGIAELPMVIGGAHSQISHSLLECEAKLKSVLGRFK